MQLSHTGFICPAPTRGSVAVPAWCPGAHGTGTGICGTCSAATASQLSPRPGLAPSGCACLALQGWRRGSEQVPCSSHDSTAGFSKLFQECTVLIAGRVYPSLRGQPPALPWPPSPAQQGFIPQETRSSRRLGINSCAGILIQGVHWPLVGTGKSGVMATAELSQQWGTAQMTSVTQK